MKQRTILSLAICTLMVCLMTSTAHAAVDTFLVFADPATGLAYPSQTLSFDFSSINLSYGVTNTVALTSSQLGSCTDCEATTGPVVFVSSFVAPDGDKGKDEIQVLTASGSLETFVFGPNAFNTYASQTDKAGDATLSVPEPREAGFTIAGGLLLAGLAFFRRKSLAANLCA